MEIQATPLSQIFRWTSSVLGTGVSNFCCIEECEIVSFVERRAATPACAASSWSFGLASSPSLIPSSLGTLESLTPAGPAEGRSETSLDDRLEVGIGDSLTREVLAVTCLDLGHGQGPGTEGDDDVVAGGGLGLDVVRVVVGVAAREALAAGDGRLRVRGVHLVNTRVVVRVDDRRNVKVGGARIAIEGELRKHARCGLSARRDGEGITDPPCWDGDGDGLASRDSGVRQGGTASPHNGPVGAVHGLEGDGVVGADQGGQGQNCQVHVLHIC